MNSPPAAKTWLAMRLTAWRASGQPRMVAMRALMGTGDVVITLRSVQPRPAVAGAAKIAHRLADRVTQVEQRNEWRAAHDLAGDGRLRARRAQRAQRAVARHCPGRACPQPVQGR